MPRLARVEGFVELLGLGLLLSQGFVDSWSF